MSLITSVLYWCMPKNRNLRVAARLVSVISIAIAIFLVWYCFMYDGGMWARGNEWQHFSFAKKCGYAYYWCWVIFSSFMNFFITKED